MKSSSRLLTVIIATAAIAAACGGKKPPVTNQPASAGGPTAFPSAGSGTTTKTPGPPAPPVVPPDPSPSASGADPVANKSVEEINKMAVLKAVFFAYDSDELDDGARKALEENAELLKKYPTWVVTVEGHCDERGTAEYNLALGDRRALASRNYILSLGIPADRLKTVSYGKEFPFSPGRDEAAYAQNRRAHFMLMSKLRGRARRGPTSP